MTAVLIISPVVKGSGNYATVCRFRHHIDKYGFKTLLASPDQFQKDSAELKSYISTNGVGLILGIHAYKVGQILLDVQVPYILVLGGTDVNVDIEDDSKKMVMTKAIKHAGHVVAFSEEMMEKFFQHWPHYSRQKTSVIPQAVLTEPSDFKIMEHISNKKHCLQPFHKWERSHYNGKESSVLEVEHLDQPPLVPDMKILIIVGGIRPVKNPMFLVKEFSEWRERKRQDCFLVFLGPAMDCAYYEKFKNEISGLPGVVHIDRLEPADTHAAIRDSFALVNSSNSEGMSLAILEAMCLNTPVVVRDIPGNTAIVTDGSTGLVYNTPTDFLDKIEQLLNNQSLTEKLTRNARSYITQQHSLQAEEIAYLTIVKRLLGEMMESEQK